MVKQPSSCAWSISHADLPSPGFTTNLEEAKEWLLLGAEVIPLHSPAKAVEALRARGLAFRARMVSDPNVSAQLLAQSSLAFLRAGLGECRLASLSAHPEAASGTSESGSSAQHPCRLCPSSHVSWPGESQIPLEGNSASLPIRAGASEC